MEGAERRKEGEERPDREGLGISGRTGKERRAVDGGCAGAARWDLGVRGASTRTGWDAGGGSRPSAEREGGGAVLGRKERGRG